MTDEERNEPKFKVHNAQVEPLPVAALTAVYQFQELLAKRGIEVMSHHRDGVVNNAILSYNLEERELLLVVATKTFLNFVKNEVFVSKKLLFFLFESFFSDGSSMRFRKLKLMTLQK